SEKIYQTSFINHALPFIRYEVTDQLTFLDEPCPCGSVFQRIADPLGRLDDTFHYDGGPTVHPHVFRSPLSQHRQLLSDLKLVGIYYDSRYPARSVAVLRDVTNSKIYRVKPAEIIGRLKVTTIRPREIVFTVQEFGFERQETLSLAKQEVSP